MTSGIPGLTAPSGRVRRVLIYFGFVADEQEEFAEDAPGASVLDRMLALVGWVVIVVATWAVRGLPMALAAAALLLPSSLLPVTERDGWLAFSRRHPILFAIVGLPVGFFAAAVIFSGASLGFCAGFAVVLSVVSALLSARRARQLDAGAPGPLAR